MKRLIILLPLLWGCEKTVDIILVPQEDKYLGEWIGNVHFVDSTRFSLRDNGTILYGEGTYWNNLGWSALVKVTGLNGTIDTLSHPVELRIDVINGRNTLFQSNHFVGYWSGDTLMFGLMNDSNNSFFVRVNSTSPR